MYLKVFSIFLVLCLGTAWGAGTEVHNPTSDISVQWTAYGGGIGHAGRISDSDDGTGVYVEDDAQEGFWEKYAWGNTALADSTIDSVKYAVRCSVTNSTNTIAVLDSIPGTAIRQTDATSFTLQNEWEWVGCVHTKSPAGVDWTWANIDDLVAGFISINIVNKAFIYVAKMYFTVYYHAEGAEGIPNYIDSIEGVGKIIAIEGSSKIQSP